MPGVLCAVIQSNDNYRKVDKVMDESKEWMRECELRQLLKDYKDLVVSNLRNWLNDQPDKWHDEDACNWVTSAADKIKTANKFLRYLEEQN